MKLDIDDILKEIVDEFSESNPLLADQKEIEPFIVGQRDRINMRTLNKELQRVLNKNNVSLENKIKAIENYLFIMKEVQEYVEYTIDIINDSYEKLKAAKAKQDEHKRKQEEEDNAVYNIFLDHTTSHIILDRNYVNYEHRKKLGNKVSKVYAGRSYGDAYIIYTDMEFSNPWAKLVLVDYSPRQEE